MNRLYLSTWRNRLWIVISLFICSRFILSHGHSEQSNLVKLGREGIDVRSLHSEQSNLTNLGKEGIDVRSGQLQHHNIIKLSKEGMTVRSGQSEQCS